MIHKAADDQMGEQCTARHDLGQRKIDSRCLADLFAASACNAGTHMAQHLEPGRHIIQHFRNILADDGIGAATGTGAGTVLCRLPGDMRRDGLA